MAGIIFVTDSKVVDEWGKEVIASMFQGLSASYN